MDVKSTYKTKLANYNKDKNKQELLAAEIYLNHTPQLKILIIVFALTLVFIGLGIFFAVMYNNGAHYDSLYDVPAFYDLENNSIALITYIISFSFAFISLCVSIFIYIKRHLLLMRVEDIFIKLKYKANNGNDK